MEQATDDHLLCYLQARGMESFLKQVLETGHSKVLGQSEQQECTEKQHIRIKLYITSHAHVVYLDGISANEKPSGRWVSLILEEILIGYEVILLVPKK